MTEKNQLTHEQVLGNLHVVDWSVQGNFPLMNVLNKIKEAIASEGKSYQMAASDAQLAPVNVPSADAQQATVNVPSTHVQLAPVNVPSADAQQMTVGDPSADAQQATVGDPSADAQQMTVAAPQVVKRSQKKQTSTTAKRPAPPSDQDAERPRTKRKTKK